MKSDSLGNFNIVNMLLQYVLLAGHPSLSCYLYHNFHGFLAGCFFAYSLIAFWSGPAGTLLGNLQALIIPIATCALVVVIYTALLKIISNFTSTTSGVHTSARKKAFSSELD